MKKTLQNNSRYNEYDLDGDGIVTDDELENAKMIKETETQLRKQLAQLRMARATLIAMGAFTLAMFLIDVERVKALSDISNLFYLSFFPLHQCITNPIFLLLLLSLQHT